MKNKALISLAFYFLLNSWNLVGAAEAKETKETLVPKDEIIRKHCNFETLLADYVLREKDDKIRSAFHKINIAINQLIDEKIAQDPSFDRWAFMLMSSLTERFGDHSDRLIFNDKERFSLHAAQMFHKIFFECEKLIKLEELFERAASPFESLKEQRGREEIEGEFFVETQKFGISSDADTPEHLSSFFEKPYQSGACLFKVVPDAPIVQKINSYRMPFICGLSGTSRVSLAALNKLASLEKLSLDSDEVFSYFFGISLCLIASNSHSLFETFYGLDICGYKVDFDFTNPQSLYLSMLPGEFKTDETILRILDEYVTNEPIQKHL
jgi:hypothetical protein